jgi:hypothetical protein
VIVAVPDPAAVTVKLAGDPALEADETVAIPVFELDAVNVPP